ncbi:MAG TPA: nuclear transport factor 2 family protein [Pyrinomonadaceae bacterium]|nr:nuclear transport factor 2 family protein [Pyrinomonadaceae bacterium]
MNKFAEKFLLRVILIGLIATIPHVEVNAQDENLTRIVKRYLEARRATMLEKSTTADVDALLAFYTENVIYEHPRVKARIEGKAKMREGMSSFLGVTKNTKIATLSFISGVNVVVAEYRVTFKAQEGSTWKAFSRTQVTLFEFEGNKIKRVGDYW